MTIAQFLQEVSRLRGWHLRGTRIRRGKDIASVQYQCPLTSVAKRHGLRFDVGEFVEAGTALKLHPRTVTKIFEAADSNLPTELRLKLLKACHLEAR